MIPEEEQHHIRNVLRIQDGEEVYFTDGKGHLAHAKLHYVGKKAEAELLNLSFHENPSKKRLHIFIAPTKMLDRTEFFLEKAVELGIDRISFFFCDRSERKMLNIEKMEKKMLSAAKQSLRLHFPGLALFSSLEKAVESMTSPVYVAHCDESFPRKTLSDIANHEDVSILVGPEGDFSPRELKWLAQKDISGISLGHRRLRTETAGIFLASWNYALGIIS